MPGSRVPILARILKDRGLVSERQLQEAIQHQVLYGGRLGTSLFELGFVTERHLTEALARAHGIVGAPFDPAEVRGETVGLVPRALASRHKVFPYKLRGKTLFLLMVDPDDHSAVAKVGYSLGYIVKPMVVPEFRMIQLLRDFYGVDERWRYTDTHKGKARRPPPPTEPGAAAAAIDAAETRDEVVESTVALCLGTFRRVVFFIVRDPWILGWTGGGEGMDREAAAALRIPLLAPSVFRTVVRDRTVFVGKIGPEDEDKRFLEALGKRPNTNAALFPIAVRGRVVNLVYGDNGATGHVRPGLGDLLLALQRVPRAYLRIIRRRVADAQRDDKEPDEEPAERTEKR